MRGAKVGLALAVLLGGSVRGAEWPYTLTIGARLQVKSPGQTKPQPLETSTRMRYSVTPGEGGEEVAIRELALTVSSEGKTISDVSLSRREASFKQGDQRADKLTYDRAPKELKATLDQFDKPMARYRAGGGADETARELLVPESSSFVENGIVDNTRLFHPPYPADRSAWEAPARLSMGEGQFAAGTLHYEKAGAGPGGAERVKVSGELKPQIKPGGDIRDGSYKVSGEQFYDPGRGVWASGRLTIDVTLELQSEGHATGTASGTMELNLEPEAGPAAAAPTADLQGPE
jgi:hypothetical protein